MMRYTLKFKSFFTLLLSSLLLVSCVSIYFTEPQPKDGIRLYEVPTELQGSWKENENSFSTIDKSGLIATTFKRDSLNVVYDTTYEKLPLSDTVRLYKSKNLYIINLKAKNQNWEIYVYEPHANGDIYTYQCVDPLLYEKDRNLKLTQAIFEIEGEETIVHTLKPKNISSESFQSATFYGQMTWKTLKKIATKKYLMNILKKDGTIFVPENSTDKE